VVHQFFKQDHVFVMRECRHTGMIRHAIQWVAVHDCRGVSDAVNCQARNEMRVVAEPPELGMERLGLPENPGITEV
jgi:hypothetical protein